MKVCFTAILLISILIISCAHQKQKERSHDWATIAENVRHLLKTEKYPSTAAKLFTHETGKLSATTRWCFIGDTGEETLAQEQVVKRLIRGGRCERIYHLGDIVYPLGISSADDPELTNRFLRYQAPFEVPYYLTLGNHEYFSLKVDPWLEVGRRDKNLRFPYFYYGHNFDGVCVAAIDSTPIDLGQTNDPKVVAQTKWMKTLPNELKSCRFKIFIAHHPYASPSKKRKAKQGTVDFYENYVLGKFDLIVAGHEHVLAYMGNFKGSEHFISGSGGDPTPATDKKMDFDKYQGHRGPGIIYLDISNNKPMKAKVSLVVLEGEKLNAEKTIFEKTLTGK